MTTKIQPMKPSIELDDDDNVYYNIRLYNDGKITYKEAIYNVSRTSPIIDNPSDYELAVVRFTIPATNIPIMLWNNWENKLSITLSYDGVDITKVLQFIPNSTGSQLYGPAVWNYQELVNIINVAFNDAFTDLKAAKPLAPPTLAPYMVYYAESKLCSIFAQQLYNTGNPVLAPPPATIEIFFNNSLYLFFPSFQSIGFTGVPVKTYQILVKNNYNNTPVSPANFYEMKQEYSTLALLNDFSTIVFATDHIPVNPEFQPSVNDTTRRIITDFEPLSDINDRQSFQYFGSGWKRYYDLKSVYPLRDIDLRIYWEDKAGNLIPVYIGENETLTTKILFRKKMNVKLNRLYRDEDDDN